MTGGPNVSFRTVLDEASDPNWLAEAPSRNGFPGFLSKASLESYRYASGNLRQSVSCHKVGSVVSRPTRTGRANWLALTGIVFVAILVTVGFTFQQVKDPPNSNLEVGENTIRRSRMWRDVGMESLFKATLDHTLLDNVYVYRWEQGDLKGWAKLDPGDGGEPIVYDLSVEADVAERREGDSISGCLVVAMRQLRNATGQQYEVRIDQVYTINSDHSPSENPKFHFPPPKATFLSSLNGRIVQTETRRGLVVYLPPGLETDFKNAGEGLRVFMTGGDYDLTLFQVSDGKSVPWLQIEFESWNQ
jgi:hypothetical protein